MPTYSEVVVGIAGWLLQGAPERLIVSVERDGSLSLRAEGGAGPAGEPPHRESCAAWDLQRGEGSVHLHLAADPARVTGSIDEPGTLFALHGLAAQYRQSRLILHLPPEHVGRSR